MTRFVFQKAIKSQEKLRMALDGPAGAGKTWTALSVGCWLAKREDGRVALIDSERSSARKYAGDFDFDHLELPDNDPRTYIDAVRAADGFAVVIVDSLSHAWEGTLDMKDKVQARSHSKDGFGAWREVTPVHNELVDVMLRAPAHVIATMRNKTEYAIDKNEHGKTVITRLGLKPVQRDGVEYEFDVVGDIDLNHKLAITKSRCSALADAVIDRPGERLAETLYDWLGQGEPLAGPAATEAITAALNAIDNEAERREAKRSFVDRFGRPEALLASRAEAATEFVNQFAPKVTEKANARLFALLAENDIGDDLRHKYASTTLGRDIASFKELTPADIETLIADLDKSK